MLYLYGAAVAVFLIVLLALLNTLVPMLTQQILQVLP